MVKQITPQELKDIIDSGLEQIEDYFIKLLPMRFSIKEKRAMADICKPLVGLVVLGIVKEIKKRSQEE